MLSNRLYVNLILSEIMKKAYLFLSDTLKNSKNKICLIVALFHFMYFLSPFYNIPVDIKDIGK